MTWGASAWGDKPLGWVPSTVSSGTDALTGQAIATAAPTVSTPAIGQTHDLIAIALSTVSITIQQATLAQHHALTAQSISTSAPTISAPTISTPSLSAAANTDPLTPQSITTGAPTISTPGIGQIHVLGGLAITTGAPTLTLPAIGPLAAVWPAVDDVLLGVMYGPTGVEYTGTATGGTGPTAADIAAAVWAYSQ